MKALVSVAFTFICEKFCSLNLTFASSDRKLISSIQAATGPHSFQYTMTTNLQRLETCFGNLEFVRAAVTNDTDNPRLTQAYTKEALRSFT